MDIVSINVFRSNREISREILSSKYADYSALNTRNKILIRVYNESYIFPYHETSKYNLKIFFSLSRNASGGLIPLGDNYSNIYIAWNILLRYLKERCNLLIMNLRTWFKPHKELFKYIHGKYPFTYIS